MGRPTEYDTIDKLQTAIASYFDDCVPVPLYYDDANGETRVATDKNGKPVIIEHPATMAGLAYHLGYSTRQAIYDLENRDEEFSYAIKRARLKIETYHEEKLATRDKPTGNIFWLKNHGWHDKTEIEHVGEKLESHEETLRKIDELLSRKGITQTFAES